MTHHVFAVDDRRQGRRSSASSPRAPGRRVLFTRTKHQAKKLAKQLTAAGIPAVDLHGNLSQNARERNLAGVLRRRRPACWCATDIAARGIHVDDVELVVHVDPPTEHKAYLHRSGRTARAGAGGTVVTVATPDQAGDVRTLARQAGITPTRQRRSSPARRVIAELTGPPAPYVEPAPVAGAAAAGPAAAAGAVAAAPAAVAAARRVRRRSGLRRSRQRGSGRAVRPGAHPRRARRARRPSSAASFSARSRRGGR